MAAQIDFNELLTTKLSDNFSWKEATVTNTGLPNIPTSEVHINNIKYTARRMEGVRALLGNKPIIVTSWYRSPEVNKAVGGVPNSQHALGEAVDFVCPKFGTPKQICELLAKYDVLSRFDQLIYEGTWVHISFHKNLERRQVLTRKNGQYIPGIV